MLKSDSLCPVIEFCPTRRRKGCTLENLEDCLSIFLMTTFYCSSCLKLRACCQIKEVFWCASCLGLESFDTIKCPLSEDCASLSQSCKIFDFESLRCFLPNLEKYLLSSSRICCCCGKGGVNCYKTSDWSQSCVDCLLGFILPRRFLASGKDFPSPKNYSETPLLIL